MLPNKQSRYTGPGFVDLLQYAALIEDGVVLCKNGSMLAGWRYTAADASSQPAEIRNHQAQTLSKALAPLGTGWQINVDAVRRRAQAYPDPARSAFPDAVSRAIDDERRAQFEGGKSFETDFILTVAWMPPSAVGNRFVALLFDEGDQAREKPQNTASVLLAEFKGHLAQIESRLSGCLSLTRLLMISETQEDGSTVRYCELLRHLQRCITGDDHPIRLPANTGIYLDGLIGGRDFLSGLAPKIGKKHIAVLSIDGLPAKTSPQILAALAELPIENRWSTRFMPLDQQEAISHLEKYRGKWAQQVIGMIAQALNFEGRPNLDAVAMVAETDQALALVSSGQASFGYLSSVLVLFDEDANRLDKVADRIGRVIQGLGFAPRMEVVNAVEGYFGSLPAHTQNIRRPLVSSRNLAHILPTTATWTGSETAPCPFYPPSSPALMRVWTGGSTPLRLNLHVHDVGHTLMFGPTGAGKSAHLALIAAQLRRYSGMRVFVFDKGKSIYALTRGVGGQHYEISAEKAALGFCPLQFLETAADFAWAAGWVESLMGLAGMSVSPGQRNEISGALRSMADSGGKTLTDLKLSLQDRAMGEVLAPYTVGGAMGNLLDAAEDGLALSDFLTFEMEELMNLGDRYALPVLLYLFRRIERSLDGRPAAILIDEGWVMLGHPVWRAKLREWFKVLRKADCLVLLATQSLSDAVNSGILDVIVESCPTKIFLANPSARDEDAQALYRRIGLNSRQIEIIAEMQPQQDYYLHSEAGRRRYQLALGPVTLAFCGASDKESLATIAALEAKHGERWPAEWLRFRGVSVPSSLENTHV